MLNSVFSSIRKETERLKESLSSNYANYSDTATNPSLSTLFSNISLRAARNGQIKGNGNNNSYSLGKRLEHFQSDYNFTVDTRRTTSSSSNTKDRNYETKYPKDLLGFEDPINRNSKPSAKKFSDNSNTVNLTRTTTTATKNKKSRSSRSCKRQSNANLNAPLLPQCSSKAELDNDEIYTNCRKEADNANQKNNYLSLAQEFKEAELKQKKEEDCRKYEIRVNFKPTIN